VGRVRVDPTGWNTTRLIIGLEQVNPIVINFFIKKIIQKNAINGLSGHKRVGGFGKKIIIIIIIIGSQSGWLINPQVDPPDTILNSISPNSNPIFSCRIRAGFAGRVKNCQSYSLLLQFSSQCNVAAIPFRRHKKGLTFLYNVLPP